MALRTIECSACGTAVPYGRLSCPECGELLASVAGAARRLTSVAAVAPPSSIERTLEPVAAAAAHEVELAAQPGEVVAAEAAPELDDDAPLAAALASQPTADPDLAPGSTAEPDLAPEVLPPARAVPSVLHDVEWPTGVDADEADDRAHLVDVDVDRDDLGALVDEPTGTGPLPPLEAPQWPPARSPLADHPVVTQRPLDALPPAPAAPGAYVPPSPAAVAAASAWPASVVDAAPPRTDAPAMPAPARAWERLTQPPARFDGDDAASRDPLPLTDPARRAEAVGWLAVAGATVAAVGFLLPWSNSVIGAEGVGYFDRWGFANAGGLLLVAALLAVLAGALVRNPIPAWIRQGLPGVILGALLIGLAWPYLFTILGAQVGALLSVIGALVLLVAGVATLALDRHAPVQPPV